MGKKTTNYEEMARNRNKTSIKVENNVQYPTKELNLLNKVFGTRYTIMIHDTITIQIQRDGKFVRFFFSF